MFITITVEQSTLRFITATNTAGPLPSGQGSGGGREARLGMTHASNKSRCHYFAKGCALNESFDTDPVLTNQHYNVFQIFSAKKKINKSVRRFKILYITKKQGEMHLCCFLNMKNPILHCEISSVIAITELRFKRAIII